MRILTAGAALFALTSAAAAHAGPAIPPELAAACGDRLAGATKAQEVGRHMQEVIYQVSLGKGAVLASITAGDNPCDSGPTCDVVPLGKPSGRTTARILDGGKTAKAYVVTRGECGVEECSSMLVIGPAAGGARILDAISVPGGCDATLSSLAIAPGQDSLGLVCSSSAGAGDVQQRFVFHVVDGKLTPQIAFDAGATIIATPDERKSGECTIRAVGAAAVVKTKDGPRLRITRAPDGGQRTTDGDGPPCKRQQGVEQDYRWDSSQKQLVLDGDSRLVVRSTCDCKH